VQQVLSLYELFTRQQLYNRNDFNISIAPYYLVLARTVQSYPPAARSFCGTLTIGRIAYRREGGDGVHSAGKCNLPLPCSIIAANINYVHVLSYFRDLAIKGTGIRSLIVIAHVVSLMSITLLEFHQDI